MRARDRLNADARYILRCHGLTAPAWARWCGWADGQWYGDVCGCPDDRCADVRYHHDPNQPCGCLDALLAQHARGATSIDDFGPGAYFITGRRVDA